MLVATGIGLITPYVAGRIVDAAILDQSLERLNRVVGLLIALFAGLGFVAYLEHYLLRATGSRLLMRLRQRVFSHLVGLSPDFYESRPVGELLSRLGSDLTVVQGAITQQIPSGIQALVRFLGTLVILLILHTRLTLVALLVIPPVVLVAVFYGRRLERLATKEQDELAAASGEAEEALSGVRTVQTFGQEHREREGYRVRLLELLDVQLRNAHIGGAFSGLIQFAAFSAFALVLWYGGRLMLRQALSPGELTSFLLYTFSIAVSIGMLGSLYASYKSLRGASMRIFHILDTPPTIRSAPDAQSLTEVSGDLELRQVRFRYPGSQGADALDCVDLHVRPGEVVGLVGPSGAGKSTIFALLQRFHDPDEGGVFLDGTDLRQLTVESVRSAMSLVPQDIFLFSGSVADNIRYGRPDASDDDVRAAAVAAGAEEFIVRLPREYDEEIGQRGVRLSMGQRQRIAIARAFLRDPVILLLDEATSSLDPESEDRVQHALGDLMRERTTLVIAHRLVTARRADRIVVLEAGRVAGSGTHDELYGSNALYRRYWQLQSLRDSESPSLTDRAGEEHG